MKLPEGVHLASSPELLLWKPSGLLNEKVVNKIIAFIRDEEAKLDANKLRFIDTTDLKAVDLNFRYVFHVALYRRISRRGRSEIRSAFLVQDPGFTHYFKLHALLTDHSSLHARLFDKAEAAAEWLGVPVESLMIQS